MLLNSKLSLLKRAEEINNISKACRELGFSRSIYYKYLKRYLKHKREGLYDKKRSKPVMPNETRKEIVNQILKYSTKYPTYIPARIANELGSIVYPAIVYNILKKYKLNKKIYRLLALEEVQLKVKISPILARKLYDTKPNNISSYYTNYLLSIDPSYVCRLKGIGRIISVYSNR